MKSNKKRTVSRQSGENFDGSQAAIIDGWDRYAQAWIDYKCDKNPKGKFLGDEWNEPEVIGIDVPADQIVSHLDEKVFKHFLGSSEVILEIGAGGGRFTDILLPKCDKLIATDTSQTMLSLLRERFASSPKIELVLLDGTGLTSIPDNSIDAAFSYDVFVHLIQQDVYNYLSELNRVLKPGGRAIIHHGNTFSELGWKKFFRVDGTFTLMTPSIFTEFTHRAGLVLEDCLTDIVRRDCISLISKKLS